MGLPNPGMTVDLERPYIEDGETVVASPRDVRPREQPPHYPAPQAWHRQGHLGWDVRQLLCTEAHMREFVEQGFEVAVVKDATAAAKVDEGGEAAAAIEEASQAKVTDCKSDAQRAARGTPSAV